MEVLEWVLTSAERGMREVLGALSRSEGNDMWIMLLFLCGSGVKKGFDSYVKHERLIMLLTTKT